MIRILVILLAQLALISCTSEKASKNSDQSKSIPFESAIEYVKKDFGDKKVAAKIAGEKLSWEQLNGSDPALAELEKKHNEQALVFAYAWASALSAGASDSQEFTFYGVEPKGQLIEILKSHNVEPIKDLQVKFQAEAQGSKLAQFGAKEVSWDQFWKANITHSQTHKKLFDQRMRRLNGMVIRRYILQASKDTNQKMEEYIQSKIMNGADAVTEADVQAFAKEKGISETDLDETMVERLTAIVKQNSRDAKMEIYVAKNLQKEPVEIGFSIPSVQLNLAKVDESVPQWGKGSDLMFIGHWSCQGCPEALKSFLETREKWRDSIHGLFLFSFPEGDRLSRMGAEAGFCVESLNKDGFWVFLESMSEQNEEISEEGINQAVKDSSVDFDKFRNCFLKREYQDKVDQHLTYAKKLGITSSPLLVLQGQVLPSSTDRDLLSEKLSHLPGRKNSSGFFARIKSFFGF